MSEFLKNGKKSFRMEGIKMSVEKKSLVKNSQIKSVMISTADNIEKVKNNDADVEEMNYADVKKFVAENMAKFVGNGKQIKINVLTAQGWRTGMSAFNSDEINDKKSAWYLRSDEYKGTVSATEIYAVQIIVF